MQRSNVRKSVCAAKRFAKQNCLFCVLQWNAAEHTVHHRLQWAVEDKGSTLKLAVNFKLCEVAR